ncbi:MAG: hypothetical protein KKD63_13400, partial [Proteobacteria bacterium]|nr:hypothetical protein [Pseudomonadota bacterium]
TSATAKAEDLFTLPPAVAAIIEQYAGPYKELIMTKIDAFQSWWQLTKPENSAELLQKAIQNM